MGSLLLVVFSSLLSVALAWSLAVRRERGRWQRLEQIRQAEIEEKARAQERRGGVRMRRIRTRRSD